MSITGNPEKILVQPVSGTKAGIFYAISPRTRRGDGMRRKILPRHMDEEGSRKLSVIRIERLFPRIFRQFCPQGKCLFHVIRKDLFMTHSFCLWVKYGPMIFTVIIHLQRIATNHNLR